MPELAGGVMFVVGAGGFEEVAAEEVAPATEEVAPVEEAPVEEAPVKKVIRKPSSKKKN